MEKGFESWFRNRRVDWKPPDPNPSSAHFGSLPRAAVPFFGTQRQEPCGWFYGLPRCRQGLVNSLTKEPPSVTTNGPQKKFLVFDQSGDQKTLIYSSGVGPIRYPKPESGSDPLHATDERNGDNDQDDSLNESHEDTEELNALLYSDDDDCSENEVTSTGRKRVREEEVASSGGPVKRREVEDKGDMVISLEEDTASSGVNGDNGVFEAELDSFSKCDTRSRKEKMKETINVLRNLIPGDQNDKNALVVIDEAIRYLRSLKVKAKDLGLDSL